jgi:3-deoxy-D-manno-octulosonic-acid transferase
MQVPPPTPPGHRDPTWLAYRLGLALLAPAWIPYAAWRMLVGGSREGRPERLGGGRQLPPLPPAGSIRAWFHGVSVGEIEALAPVVSAFRALEPSAEVVVTATTPTGRARAEALYPDILERRFAPIDLPWTTSRALRRIRPSVLVLGESELWPSLLRQASRSAPVVVVNARLSDRTMPRARRVRLLYRWMLARLTAVGVQTAEDRDRFIELGLDPRRVTVTGNTKFDRRVPSPSDAERASLRAELGVGESPLVVAGSTFPGEDELLLDALAHLRSAPFSSGASTQVPARRLRLVLAPRHPERGDAIEALILERGLGVWRRSRGPAPPGADPDVVLLDTVGELARVYALARVAVVGRSFRTGGGQNPLEPMAHGVPVVYGPKMGNFREIARLAEIGGAAVRCHDDGELIPALERILSDDECHDLMAVAGPRVLDAHRGASERSARLIAQAGRQPHPAPDNASYP